MDDELRNAASDAAKRMTELMLDPERFDDLVAMVADDFVQQDRRTLVGTPDLDKAAWIEVAGFFLSESPLATREREVLAVRGDRLLLTRVVDTHRDGSEREFLALGHFDGDPVQTRRTVMFDPDDLGGAMMELDRLHAEIEANDS